jgi:hypothetical protein
MYKTILILTTSLLFVCTSTILFAQSSPTPASYPFRQEIGLDLVPFIGGDKGFNVIWNRQIENIKVKKWDKRTMIHIHSAFIHQQFNTYEPGYRYGFPDTLTSLTTSVFHKNTFRLALGFERQISQNMIQFYYGAALSFQTNSIPSHSIQSFSYKNNIQTLVSVNQAKSAGYQPGILLFGGCKYLFSPHWSVGLELDVNNGIEFRRTESSKFGVDKSTVLHSGWDYPLLLYVRYHFSAQTLEQGH